MADKPLARRLDDIENKMDSVLNSNIELTAVLTNFQENTVAASEKAIQENLTREIERIIKSSDSLSHEWQDIIVFCNKHNISTESLWNLLHLYTDLFRKNNHNIT